MENLRNFFLAAVLFLCINATVQSLDNVAHINFAEIIQAMHEYAQVQKSIADLQVKYKADYYKMVQEFQTKGEKYQQEADTAGDATNAARSKEMEEMGMRISQFEQNAAIDMQKKSTDLNNPIMDKAFKAVEKVANAGGYNYVFDSG